MKGITLTALLSLLLAGIMAAPMCSEDSETGGCKVHEAFRKVDCIEKLKFKHAQASCFMNDKDEFIILAVNNRRLSKRSIVSDEKSLYSPYGGKVTIRRLKRSVNAGEDFEAEVLNSRDLQDLLNKQMDIATDNPLATNVATSNTDDGSDLNQVKGVIVIIAGVEGGNNEVIDRNETSLTTNGDEDLAETLFGLLLLGAILEEMKKHQNSENSEQTSNYDI